MARLELRIPPDLVALAVAGLMWLASVAIPWPGGARVRWIPAAAVLLVAGTALIVAARVAFARIGTTFSPVAPQHSRRLVTTGVYRFTRNPMYLGTLLVLLAFAAWLAHPWAAVATLSYVAYIDRFQIRPEERVLRARFGSEYADYVRTVRRWI